MRRAILHLLLAAALVMCAAVLARAPRLTALSRSDELVDRAEKLGREGQSEAARAAVDEALKVAPDNPRARRALAMHHVAWRRFDKALVELERVAQQRPYDAGAAREVGELLIEMGKGAEAVPWLRASVQLDPLNGVALAELAAQQVRTGDLAGARESARRAASLAPRVPLVQFHLGYVRQQSGDLAGAEAAFKSALQLRPGDVQTLLALAALAGARRRPTEVAQYLARAASIAPDQAAIWTALGRALLDVDRPREAGDAFARALALDKDNSLARAGLATARSRVKQADVATAGDPRTPG